MKKQLFFMLLCLLLVGTIWGQSDRNSGQGICSSPNGKTKVCAKVTPSGELIYTVTYNGKTVVADSKLGFRLSEGDFSTDFEMLYADAFGKETDETWKPVWGETSEIRNHYREMLLQTRQRNSKKLLNIRFKIYDDGVGFRYEFPANGGYGNTIVVEDEKTEFRLTEDLTAFWIPGDWDSNEHRYSTTLVSEINASGYVEAEKSISTKHLTGLDEVQTPITFRSPTGFHAVIHEAALVDFPAMQLTVDKLALSFKASLVPSIVPTVKATVKAGFNTPWRVVLFADNAAGILESKIILNLNEPSKIAETSWIKPQKYVGIWWEMHVGKSTWDYAGSQNAHTWKDSQPTGKHGATTENTKKYIDFAAKNGFDGVLVEGWNTGWEDWFGKWIEDVFDFTTPYPDYNIAELSKYAAAKGVKIIMHHETSSAVTSYEKRMNAAYELMKKYGMNSVKTGYVGRIIPKGEWHDGQLMVNHYIRVAQRTAANKIMLDAHEPVRPTGLSRTYPNWLACEAGRGNEFNGWSRGNLPEHETILPFTRLLGGPMDYTPGIFDVKFEKWKQGFQVHTTVAKQLALYVTMYSPLQMAADLVENYESRMDIFQFIKDVAVDWSDTKILNAEIGDYLTVARKAKGTNNWFVGSITDESQRNLDIKLDFLDAGRTYEATIYCDGINAHWQENPTEVTILKINVQKGYSLLLRLAAGGGAAISLTAK